MKYKKKNTSKIEVIAEIGINHNNDLEKAFELIEVAKRSGAKIAKFQYYKADYLYPKSAGEIVWKDDDGEYRYDIYESSKQFELADEWVEKLIEKCDLCNIEFMSSVFHKKGLDFLLSKGMKKIKISSSNITNIPLIEYCARKKLPIYISTGGANLSEVYDAVDTILQYHDQIILMQCNLNYPAKLDQVNLGVLETFKYAFPDVKLGFSDHTREVFQASVQAVYLGATVIEKHITYDKNASGPDHFFSLEEDDLKLLVKKLDDAYEAKQAGCYKIDMDMYGRSEKKCLDYEDHGRSFGYTSLFANRLIKKGSLINDENVSVLRVANKERGVSPNFFKVLGNYSVFASRDIDIEEPIKIDMVVVN